MTAIVPSLATIDDFVVGSVGRSIPPSPRLDHLGRFLSSYSGSDKMFMVIQYTLKLIEPIMAWRARIQHRYGKRSEPVSRSAPGLAKIASLISDSRMLWRLFGLVPIFQWLSQLERVPPISRRLRTIERLQALSMLVYYPLEHLYYFGAHSIYNISPAKLASLSLWSTRAWTVYILLHFLHLREDVAHLIARGQALRRKLRQSREVKEKAGLDIKAPDNEVEAEIQAIKKRRTAILVDFVVNLAYFPQTVHWSLEKGYFTNDIWMSLFGFIAGIASFKGGWDATA
ncbi:hypothetical protein FRB99_006002 [Tulasnella sp. 403]|nr:hypothetical protein FRB99_006002 [Tulasnella sp. 403]